MRTVLQRAKNAQVEIDGKVNGKIDHGLVLLVGFEEGDGQEEIDYTVRKIVNCRIFSDENGKMNLSLKQIGGQILSVSQFTLYADTKRAIGRVLLTRKTRMKLQKIMTDSMKSCARKA